MKGDPKKKDYINVLKNYNFYVPRFLMTQITTTYHSQLCGKMARYSI
jgi:hypothetical protein